MIPWQAVVSLVALLCAVGLCQTERYADLRKEYLEKCKSSHPNVKNMDVWDYEPYACTYTCQWKDDKGNYITDRKQKDNGLRCRDVKYPTKEPLQCLNGTCVLSVDVRLCQDQGLSIGNLQNVDSNHCSLSCIGEGTAHLQKPEGSTCTLEKESDKPAKCNVFGRCAEVMTYVSDPSGGMEANEEAQGAVGDSRHPDVGHHTYTNRWPDPCQWVSYYEDRSDGTLKNEYLSFEDGYSCGEGKECLGGRCVKLSYFQACKEKIREDVVEMEYKECRVMCYGKTVEANIKMPFNATCHKRVNSWQQAEGVCSAGGRCVIKK